MAEPFGLASNHSKRVTHKGMEISTHSTDRPRTRSLKEEIRAFCSRFLVRCSTRRTRRTTWTVADRTGRIGASGRSAPPSCWSSTFCGPKLLLLLAFVAPVWKFSLFSSELPAIDRFGVHSTHDRLSIQIEDQIRSGARTVRSCNSRRDFMSD